MSTPSVNSAASTPITPTLTSGTTGTSTSTSTDPDKDTFLKLLVAQLKYQDPSNPTDSSQFMAQTAQFTMVEKLDDLNTAQTQLLASTQLQAATSMVGRQVTYNDNGTQKTGVVSAVTVTDNTPSLTVNGATVALSQISKVEAAPAA